MARALRVARSILLTSFALAAAVSGAAAGEAAGRVATADWLQANLERADVRVVDLRASVQEYWKGHIPGAVYLSSEALKLPDGGVPVKLAPPEILAAILGRLGIQRTTTVVVYGAQSDFTATYLAWALDYLKHPSTFVLDGGFSKWAAEGRPVTQEYPRISPVTYVKPRKTDESVRATLAEVKDAVENGTAVVLDIRPPEMYRGEKGNWKRLGHIKGAVSHFWGLDIREDGTWKGTDELKAAFESIGATPDRRIIVSCGQGAMSSHTYFTLKHILGYPLVEQYDGSFNEWSNVDALPVETAIP